MRAKARTRDRAAQFKEEVVVVVVGGGLSQSGCVLGEGAGVTR